MDALCGDIVVMVGLSQFITKQKGFSAKHTEIKEELLK
jgi:hypothetical protein